MQHLREVDGDAVKDNTVKLGENTITREELEKRQQDQSVRVIETAPGVYKELNRLRG